MKDDFAKKFSARDLIIESSISSLYLETQAPQSSAPGMDSVCVSDWPMSNHLPPQCHPPLDDPPPPYYSLYPDNYNINTLHNCDENGNACEFHIDNADVRRTQTYDENGNAPGFQIEQSEVPVEIFLGCNLSNNEKSKLAASSVTLTESASKLSVNMPYEKTVNSSDFGTIACCFSQGLIYFAGPDIKNNQLFCTYNCTSKEWCSIKYHMHIKREKASIVAVGPIIYAIGGFNRDNGRAVEKIERYDPQKQNWKCVGTMSNPCWSCAVASYQNKIYIFGGCNSYDNQKLHGLLSISCYDTSTQETRHVGNLPFAMTGGNAIIRGNVAHVVSEDGKVVKYDILRKTCSVLKKNSNIHVSAIFIQKNRLNAFGKNKQGVHGVYRFDDKNRNWIKQYDFTDTPMPDILACSPG